MPSAARVLGKLPAGGSHGAAGCEFSVDEPVRYILSKVCL